MCTIFRKRLFCLFSSVGLGEVDSRVERDVNGEHPHVSRENCVVPTCFEAVAVKAQYWTVAARKTTSSRLLPSRIPTVSEREDYISGTHDV